jgi:hypothetical protein
MADEELGWVPVKVTMILTAEVFVGTPELPKSALRHIWDQFDTHGMEAFLNEETVEIRAVEWVTAPP